MQTNSGSINHKLTSQERHPIEDVSSKNYYNMKTKLLGIDEDTTAVMMRSVISVKQLLKMVK